MPYYVQLYKSTDLNSPPLSGQTNSSIVVFNACLVDGYAATVSITGITRSSNTATATVSAADGLKLKTGQYLTVSGANESDYNGTFLITVASTTTFTYTVANTPTTPATGTIVGTLKLPITSITRGGAGNLTATLTMPQTNNTLVTGNYMTITGCTSTGAAQYNGTFQITVTSSTTFTYLMASDPGANATVTGASYYKAGLQWTRPYSAGTNSQTFKSATALGANGETYVPRYLQIIDNAATAGTGKEAQLYGAEVMGADQTNILGRFPTTTQAASGLCFRKSTTADSTVREWTVFGDEKTFTIINNSGDGTPWLGMSFGYFISVKAGDEYNTYIAGTSVFNTGSSLVNGFHGMAWLANAVAHGGLYICRSFTQAGTAVSSSLSGSANAASMTGAAPVLSGSSQTFITAPNPSDNGYYIQPLFLQDGTVGQLRGRVPGWYSSLQGVTLSNYDTITNVVGLSGKTLTALSVTYSTGLGMGLVDTFGPWT
jgi:hypothetical protein